VSIQELRAEHEANGIGPLMMTELRTLCSQVARKYPPAIFSDGPTWDATALDDLLQDLVVGRLLHEGQLAYVMLHSNDLDEFRRLMIFQVKRTLSGRRRRSVVDNLLERSRQVLRDGPYEATGGRYRLQGSTEPHRDATESEVREAALVARAVPRVPVRSLADREPVVYRASDLALVLRGIANALPCSFTERDLDHIFRLILTDLLPADLEALETTHEPGQPAADPSLEPIIAEIVTTLMAEMDSQQKTILRMKASDVSDADIAGSLGISRPTLANRKHVVFDRLHAALDGLDPTVQDRAMERLLGVIISGGDES
jgi:hypothetical protein